MQKIIEIRKSAEKKFDNALKTFNKIAEANGEQKIVAVRLGDTEIHCSNIVVSSLEKAVISNFHWTVPGTKYSINIPDNDMAFNNHRLIGYMFKEEDIWIKKSLTDNYYEQEEITEKNFRCDHCGKKINNRKGYYFFHDADDKLVVIGSTCVKKFYGFNAEKVLKKLGEILGFEDIDRNCRLEKSEKMNFSVSLRTVYALTKYYTNDFKYWIKKDDPEKVGTSQQVRDAIYGIIFNAPEYATLWNALINNLNEEDDKNINLATVYWMTTNGTKDIDHNIKNVIKEERCPIHLSGYATWGFFKAIKAFQQLQNSNTVVGDFVESVGARIEKNLTVKKSSHYNREIFNGWKYEVISGSRLQFEDELGNTYVNFCSSDKTIGAVEEMMGKEMKLRFTISDHRTENNGAKTNIIQRIFVVKK